MNEKQKNMWKIKTPYGTKNWAFVKRVFDTHSDLVEALKSEHIKTVAEFSGNMGGHLAVREGIFYFDEDTKIEKCQVCDLILKAEGVQ